MILNLQEQETSLDLDMEQALTILQKAAPYVSEQDLFNAMAELVDSLIDKCRLIGEDVYLGQLVEWRQGRAFRSTHETPALKETKETKCDSGEHSPRPIFVKHRHFASLSISSSSSVSSISSTTSSSPTSQTSSNTFASPSPSSRASPYSQMLKASMASKPSPKRLRFTDKLLSWWKRST